MELGLELTERAGVAVIAVTGEVDVASAPRLREQIVSVVSDGAPRIVCDLDGVEFLDSTGLGVLVGALKRCRTHGSELVLVCNQSSILKVFEITGLLQVFEIHKTVEAAVAAG
jgi:anti-sigma B factor antagonist